MARLCKNWLDAYMDYTANQESPPIFHRWVGMTVLSSILGRRVQMDHGAYQVHPNLFTVLVGPSALVKKTTAISLGKRIVDDSKLKVQVIPQSTTPEAFVRDLAKYTRDRKDESMTLICAPEMLVFLRVRKKSDESVMIPLLTDLWDGQRPWTATTIKRGAEEIEYGNVSFIAGTTREWLIKAIPSQTTAGGFTGRCMFIEADGAQCQRIPYPSFSKASKLAGVRLAEDLRQIATLKGSFTLSAQARQWYADWYVNELRTELEQMTQDEVAGFYGRVHDHVMKVAMILAVAEGDALIIEQRHLVLARAYVRDMEPRQRAVTEGMMATPFSEDCHRVVEFVTSRNGFATWTDILKHMSRDYTAKRLRDEVIVTLEQMGKLEWVPGKTPTGKIQTPGYRLLQEGAAPYIPTVGAGQAPARPEARRRDAPSRSAPATTAPSGTSDGGAAGG